MSRHHAWLRFTTRGDRLPLDLESHGLGEAARGWQRDLTDLHRQWYGVAPPQVAAVFVLQWLLQVPAHTAAYAAVSGRWRAMLDELSFTLGPALVPDTVRLTRVVADDSDRAARLRRAEADYRAVAEPLARAYPARVNIGPHTRSALVDDMWTAAARDAEAAAGVLRAEVPPRTSCCLIYALPGCVECAGCPRVR